MDTRQMIRCYIAENFLFSANGYDQDDGVSFLETGIINSLGIMELVQFVEQAFGIAVADEEIVPANFDSVNQLVAYIEARNHLVR
jgi:acyl carrier protein